ncbi:A24 family peptidase C-terminal domain-containing protein [Thermococcus sp. 21S7]|uniref:A24 family peptidase C-terminal domain-containing protein n=1 Tax=Thermococcus sp. 21S7 TaxID=1638221 RepID=UPI00143A6343|nr:A24 family peptidase C-terminal domain-containing protein [Thermococcus sp. 21S7]NJE60315.1 transposase [Thermococcus sp. 21S7]
MEIIPLVLGVLAGIMTSYTDIKTGFIYDVHAFPTLTVLGKLLGWEEDEAEEVDLPGWIDKVIIPAAEVGIVYYLYRGLTEHNAMIATAGFIGLIIGFLLGFLLYYLGAWASGDIVVLAAFSALLPFAPDTARIVPPYGVGYPLYPISLLFNSILAVFPFILLYSFGVLIAKGKTNRLAEVFAGGIKTAVEFALWLMAIVVVGFALAGKGLGGPAAGVVSFVILLPLFARFRIVGDVAGIAALAYLLYLDPTAAYLVLLKTLAVSYILKVLLSTISLMRTEVLVEEVTVQELREWDILGEVIHEMDGRVLRDRGSGLERFKKALLSWDFKALRPVRGRVIASPTAEGLSREQIEELKRLVEEGKIENSFLRKKSMPFAPALFLGFLISYFWGDVFWWLVLRVAGL